MKNIIIVTGGAGFVGSNLIEKLLLKNKFKIISIDNYSTGSKKNHLINKNVKYIKDNTENIEKILKKKLTIFTHYFTLVNSQEFIKVFQNLMNVCNQTLLDQRLYLIFV